MWTYSFIPSALFSLPCIYFYRTLHLLGIIFLLDISDIPFTFHQTKKVLKYNILWQSDDCDSILVLNKSVALDLFTSLIVNTNFCTMNTLK